MHSHMLARLLAAGREVRTIVASSTRTAKVRAMTDTGAVQPDPRVSFIADDRDGDAGRLDGAAGCEFVDDRIHLLE